MIATPSSNNYFFTSTNKTNNHIHSRECDLNCFNLIAFIILNRNIVLIQLDRLRKTFTNHQNSSHYTEHVNSYAFCRGLLSCM